MLNIILPCAGIGSRLWNHTPPYSKELHSINGKCLIDYSLELIEFKFLQNTVFTIIINENKIDVIKYLSKYKHTHKFQFIFQSSSGNNFTDAVLDSEPFLQENNLILLPDTIISYNNSLWTSTMNFLKNNNFGFYYKLCDNEQKLKSLGSLQVKNDTIIKYCDKPIDTKNYNGFWGAIMFKHHIMKSIMSDIHFSSKFNQPVNEKSIILDSKGIEIQDFVDMGTWENINHYYRYHF